MPVKILHVATKETVRQKIHHITANAKMDGWERTVAYQIHVKIILVNTVEHVTL